MFSALKHLERVDYTVYKCEATNLVDKSEAMIEIFGIFCLNLCILLLKSKFILSKINILDLQETEQYNTNNNNGKTVRKNQSISFVLNSPYLDEVMKSDDAETGQLEEESDEFKSKSKEATISSRKKLANMRKNNNNNNNNNKTFHKYQINKSNSIQETENSLQRINGRKIFVFVLKSIQKF